MIDSLVNAEKRYDELAQLLASPEVTSDYEEVIRLARERSELQDLVETYHRYRATEAELE